ncbi:MAG: hypothetical protein ACYDD0_08510 [Candidatus Dormibacteria bacterium]
MPPYADPEVRRQVNREALRRKRAAERRDQERAAGNGHAPPPLSDTAPTWRAPTQQRTAPPQWPEGRPSPVYYRVLPTQPRARGLDLPPLPVLLVILLVAGGVMAGVWFVAHHQSADEFWDPIE